MLAGQLCDGGEEASPGNASGVNHEDQGWSHIPTQSSALGRAGAPAAASCPAWLLISKHCKACPGLAISRPVPGDYPALPVLGKRSISECQSPGARCGTGDPRPFHAHTHVHSPENGEELILEANLFCSNPAAVTGSAQVPGSADHIAFMPSPSASLSHSPVAGGGEGTGTKGKHRSRRLFYLGTEHEGRTDGDERKPGGSRLQSRALRPPPARRLPLFTHEVPPSSSSPPGSLTSSCLSPLAAEMLIHRARRRGGVREAEGAAQHGPNAPDLAGCLHTGDGRQRSRCR